MKVKLTNYEIKTSDASGRLIKNDVKVIGVINVVS